VAVASKEEGRGHLYHAAVSRESYQARSLKQFVSAVFDGTPSMLVRSLMDSDSLTSEELALLSYNDGTPSVDAAIRKTGSHDAWRLVQEGIENDPEYLARVMAAVLIIKNPHILN
jgi:hypothetical protein